LHYSGGSVELYVANSFSGSGTWIGATNSWNTGTNWLDANSANGVPGNGLQGQGMDTATFNGSGVTAITLDISASIAGLSFSGLNYSITGGNTLILNSASGTSSVTVTSGTQSIATGVQIVGGSLVISTSNNGALAISGNITDDGQQRSLTLAGDGTGQLVLSGNNSYGGATNVQAGTLIVESPTALPNGSSLTVGAGASQLFGSAVTASPIVSNASAVSGVSAVPEPGTLALLLAGLVVGFGARFVKRRG
jgi:autotransporter-associated beta strand protein